LLLAHFTPMELPGTLAVWVAGIGLGLVLGTRGGRAALWPLALMAALAVLGMLGDTYSWSPSAQAGIDAAFLLAAVALVVAFGFRLRGAREEPSSRP
jgi:hypothetical protein